MDMISTDPADSLARDVLSCYAPEIAHATWTPLGNAGGFSGARIWRGQAQDGRRLCLREWPALRTTEDRLQEIHVAMRQLAELPFVPDLVATQDDSTIVQLDDSFWEISTWMPGTADFHRQPTDARLFAAMRTLASMHELLVPVRPVEAPCPAVKRILRALRGWRDLLQSGWKPDFNLPRPAPIPALARRAWKAISADTYSIEFTLVEWEVRVLPVQFCLCDIWHDHILFEGDEVTGVIDYGAVKPDCVAIDLARLLGSMIPDEPERMHRALAIYSAIHAVPSDILRLSTVLDRAGSVVGLTNWLRWLYLEKRTYTEAAGVAKRMEALLKRVELKMPAALSPWASW
jgi:Ser/Thr protein kinase RdoA (MazF antagonist)